MPEYRLVRASIQPGDVLLTRDSGWISRSIRATCGGNFSHAMIVENSGLLIEAVGQGVWKVDTNNMYIGDPDNICVLRVKEEFCSNSQACAAVNYLSSYYGSSY